MKKQSLIFDAHLDLSMNAMEWNRDLRWTVEEIRKSEHAMTDKPDRGRGTVSFPEMRKGNVGLCVATQIARYVKPKSTLPGWNSPEQAWSQTQGQLAWYKAMEESGEMVQIKDLAGLEAHLNLWEAPDDRTPIGYILSLEGADSICTIDHLERAYAQGLRAIGPAHYGPGTYAQGTDATGGLGEKGRALIKEIDRLGMILDATHLCDDSFWEAMDNFSGHVWASHNNCRSLVPHNRQFSDEQLKELISRGAVIGAALDAWMMVTDWKRGVSTPVEMNVSLETMVDHIDHICQLAGSAQHVAIGTDLDGAFGTEQGPKDLDTIADLQKVPSILQSRGYTETDINGILSQNWIDFLRKAWA
ncbi:dipeptidase [Reichenbachiella agariperforans]|uniref:dipeptidase n=1 Tax=Reichenbachiella agariperforans TaxID=156994 RepID=UPI001C0801CF|nr:membrane dipeptidase [Reichenbachiella agariperforans]MBU2914472.1 membrane dipeptidase [Reichenbachiella agariperforans]